MTNEIIDYKKFYEILDLTDTVEQEKQLTLLIDSYLAPFFGDDERRWFNTLCNRGLINLVHHCERTIPDFTLYDNNEKPESFSNVSFLWAIESGNFELIQYFTLHEDFYKFSERLNLEYQIGSFVQSYRKKNKIFNLQNYEKIIDFLISKFPWAISHIFDSAVMGNHNEYMTYSLKSFVSKYKSYLIDHLTENDNDNLTRYCMISLNQYCFEFAEFLKSHYPEIPLQKDRLEMLLYYSNRDISIITWIVDHPTFFILKEENFNELYKRIFQNPFGARIKKEDYDMFFHLVSVKLHQVTKEEMQLSLDKNLIRFVRKFHNKFKDTSFNLWADNTATHFWDKQQKQRHYKILLNKLPAKGTPSKKLKI